MSLFPNVEVNVLSNTANIEYGKEIDCSLENGEPIVYEGIEALKIWVYKTLSTLRYVFPIYSTDYGTEIDVLIGKNLSLSILEKEFKRQIVEALTIDDRIKDVSNFSISQNKDSLNISFSLTTFLNDILEVNQNV